MSVSKQAELLVFEKLYVNGQWVAPAGNGTLDVINSTTEEVMGRIPEGTPEDINRAVESARAAFEGWSTTPIQQRAELLTRMSAGLGARQSEIAAIIAAEVGMTLPLANAVQAGMPAMEMGSYAKQIGRAHV